MLDKDTRVVSTTQLAEGAAGLVRHVRDSGQAVMVVEDGETAAVLVTAAEFALLREQRRFIAAVEDGLTDVDAGNVLSTEELKRSLETELGPIAWQ